MHTKEKSQKMKTERMNANCGWLSSFNQWSI